jgi:hypothetical protein
MVPHPGRESSKKASHSLRRRICTRPDNDDAPLDPYTRSLCSSGLVSDADQDAGFMTAPSGTTPCVANRQDGALRVEAMGDPTAAGNLHGAVDDLAAGVLHPCHCGLDGVDIRGAPSHTVGVVQSRADPSGTRNRKADLHSWKAQGRARSR